jgi:uncharacterized membrane-anchored protein
MRSKLAAAVLAALFFVPAAYAQEGDQSAEVKQFLSSLHYQSGDVKLSDAGATLHVQSGFHYLGHDDARKVLEDYWGNPPDDEVLGMLGPDNAALGSEHSWGVVLTYVDEGHVSDEDAAKTDYTQMMKDMQEASVEQNEEAKRQGYDTVNIIGWAQPPSYDAANKRIYWARELDFSSSEQNTLNYDIRVLGREGYLSMNAVADMRDLSMVKEDMKRVIPMAEFDAGQRYADFNESTDKVAAYGLAALVGGGIAAKAGLFAKLGALLLAFKKFIVLGVIAIGAAAKKLFGGKDKRDGGTVA